MKNSKFKKLFEPSRIGKMELRNRIVMPAMYSGYATKEGYISQRLIDYYEARAKGGAGLIIIELTSFYAPGRAYLYQAAISDDSYIPGWKKLTDAIHKHGARVAVQLNHGGRGIIPDQTRNQPVGPSAVPLEMGGMPHELTVEEIAEITRAFADGARRAKEAGFDGIEVHGAHQYLLSSFLSSTTNTREDKYGGSLENKARFLIEVIRDICKEVGADFPLWTRLSGQEFGMENGITIEETKKVVPMAIEAGAQAIHVSAWGGPGYLTKAPAPDVPGWIVPLAEEVKKVCSVPVIIPGRLDAELAERILEEGKADFTAIGRRLIADPELPKKAAEDRLEDINPCIGCYECLLRGSFVGDVTKCAINPVTSREGDYQLQPAVKKKRVVVVGGGPAGMESARVAALRGHQVTLFEKGSKLGGNLKAASIPPYKEDIVPYINYMVRQVDKAGVKVRLNTEATVELIMAEKPDAVIIAAGSIALVPEIAGTTGPNVTTASDVLAGKMEVGQNVVIIGGGMVGCETGHFLAEKGKKVTIIEVLPSLASDMLPMVKERRLDGLGEKRVATLTSTTCEGITRGGVTVTTGKGQKQTIPADSIILAVGFKPNDSLFKALEGKVPEVYNIGDSSQVRHIMAATSDGCRVGHAL